MATNDDEVGGHAPTDEADEEHVCEACGKAFETESALERHVHDAGLVD